ncbi:helix-turn-helix domain-containing protein [Halobacillus seohaensis]|uniref:Helix-turn-helix domain-containing protein n=1 Tax=Halobacillus seohaensis TaxID=447421 RepID=A0ABW2EU31_9BACI
MNGEQLRQIRFKEGLTQEEFAGRIGFHQSYISAMENESKPISEKTRYKVRTTFETRE